MRFQTIHGKLFWSAIRKLAKLALPTAFVTTNLMRNTSPRKRYSSRGKIWLSKGVISGLSFTFGILLDRRNSSL